MRKEGGFTLVEMMVVATIVSVLAAQAISSYNLYAAKVRRTEATIAMNDIWRAQYSAKLTTGRYAKTFDELGFALDRGRRVSPTRFDGKYYTYEIGPVAGGKGIRVTATGNPDGDKWLDVIVSVFK